MPWHPVERRALADALEAAGPGAPTLCEGWRSEHLAAHVRLREADPLTGLGIVVPPLADRTERKTQASGDGAVDPAGWRRLVEQVRRGPHRWHPLNLIGDRAQLAELHIHAEDVRRGGPQGPDVPARQLETAHQDALWLSLRQMAPMLYRRAPRRLVLVDETDRRHECGPGSAPGGAVEVRGPVTELLLHGYGRNTVAHVQLVGEPADVAVVREWRPLPA